jgi:hypothetical protein
MKFFLGIWWKFLRSGIILFMFAFYRTAKRRKNVFLRQCAEQGSNPDSKIRAVEDNAVAEIGELNHLSVPNVTERCG